MAGQQIDEKIFIDVNGCRQGMFIQSVNADNPVLLFLHGGPSSPEVAFNAVHPTGFEKIFTVCWWEQRGSGISYSGKIPKESLTLDQMIEDTIAVTNYLRKRFGKDKIFSYGTFLGRCVGNTVHTEGARIISSLHRYGSSYASR